MFNAKAYYCYDAENNNKNYVIIYVSSTAVFDEWKKKQIETKTKY